MTSRTLSLNLLKGELKRKIWMYALTLFAFIALQPGKLLMDIDRYMMWGLKPAQIAGNIKFSLSISNLGELFLVVGVFYGCVIFGYMFSRSKVDMYHSLPIKRERQFVVRFLSGLIPFTMIEIFTVILNILVLSIKGYQGFGLEKIVINTGIYSLFIFTVCFGIITIALSVTGNLLVALMLGAGLMIGEEFITMIIRWYKSYCFQTYSSCSEAKFTWWRFILAPSEIGDRVGNTIDLYPGRFAMLVAEALVITIIAMYLYKIRPSESAGKAVCYKILQPIIRIPAVAIAALAGGIYLVFVSGDFMTAGWYWMIFILVGVVTHVILEIILQLDFKKAFKHWPEMIISLVAAAFIACFFLYDICGYDRYLPDRNKVENYAIALENIDSDISFFEFNDNDEITYLDRDEYILGKMRSSDNGAIMQLASVGVAALNTERSVFKRIDRERELNNMSYEEWAEKYGLDPNAVKTYYTIGYTLKSGKRVYRSYQADLSETYAPIEAVYNSDEYKDAAYQIDDIKGKNYFKRLDFSDAVYNTAFSLSGEDTDAFLEAYSKDLKVAKLNEIAEAYPLYQIGSVAADDDMTYMDLTYGYYVYPSYVNSLNFLRSKGAEIDIDGVKLDPKRIEHIEVTDYSQNQTYYGKDMMYQESYMQEPAQITYDSETDGGLIEEIADVAVLDHFAYVNDIFKPYEDNIDINLYYQTDKGFVNNYYVRIPKGKLPQRIRDDLDKANSEAAGF